MKGVAEECRELMALLHLRTPRENGITRVPGIPIGNGIYEPSVSIRSNCEGRELVKNSLGQNGTYVGSSGALDVLHTPHC